MPSHEEHCQESLRRYGKTFSELHRWMDEPSTLMASKHRMYRHDPYRTPKVAKALFGEYADQACLDHIRLDELERRRKGTGKMLISIRETRQSKMQHPLFYAFWTLVSLLIGFEVSTDSMLFGIILYFISFLCFLAFLASLSQPKLKTATEEYLQTCSKCGTKYNAELDKCPNCGQE